MGSVTGQIGHTLGASAMASLIKASLEMEHGSVPPTFGLQTHCHVARSTPSACEQRHRAVAHAADYARRSAAGGRQLAWPRDWRTTLMLERGERGRSATPMPLRPRRVKAPATKPATRLLRRRLPRPGGSAGLAAGNAMPTFGAKLAQALGRCRRRCLPLRPLRHSLPADQHAAGDRGRRRRRAG